MSVKKTKDQAKKVDKILISQPEPENGKSPYLRLKEKYGTQIDFRPFIHIEEVTVKEVRKARVVLNDYSGIILTSRNAIDHLFRIAESMKVNFSQNTKYYCISESIALYLQKYTQYRKRKVFFGSGNMDSFKELLLKHQSKEKFIFPCSDIKSGVMTDFLAEEGFEYKEAVFYRTVASDLSDIEKLDYDMIAFFSPSGVKSLLKNFPSFKESGTRIAAFGKSTCDEVEESGLELAVKAPIPEAKSMSMAIERYLKDL